MTEKNQTAVENKDLVVTFDKPYPFEGTDYKQIDLSNLENVTGAQLASVEQKVTALVPELSLDYALLLAAVVTGKPVEFFTQLPGRQAIKVKRTVSGVFERVGLAEEINGCYYIQMTSKDVRKTCVKLAKMKIDSFTAIFEKALWEINEIVASVNEVYEEDEQRKNI